MNANTKLARRIADHVRRKKVDRSGVSEPELRDVLNAITRVRGGLIINIDHVKALCPKKRQICRAFVHLQSARVVRRTSSKIFQLLPITQYATQITP